MKWALIALSLVMCIFFAVCACQCYQKILWEIADTKWANTKAKRPMPPAPYVRDSAAWSEAKPWWSWRENLPLKYMNSKITYSWKFAMDVLSSLIYSKITDQRTAPLKRDTQFGTSCSVHVPDLEQLRKGTCFLNISFCSKTSRLTLLKLRIINTNYLPFLILYSIFNKIFARFLCSENYFLY